LNFASSTALRAGEDRRTEKSPLSRIAAAAPQGARPPSPLEERVIARLEDDKAQDIVFIDVMGRSPLADGLVIASGRSARHVAAMADHLLRALKDAGCGRARVEGAAQADWVLIDAGDLVVHLFRPDVRAYYNLEKIWSVESAQRSAVR
jgi:ribosome-associated protein